MSGDSSKRVVDGDRSAAIWVAIGLGSHEGDRESNLVLGGAIDGPAAGAESTIPVGDVSNASVVGVAAGASGGWCVKDGRDCGCENVGGGEDGHDDCFDGTHDDGLEEGSSNGMLVV